MLIVTLNRTANGTDIEWEGTVNINGREATFEIAFDEFHFQYADTSERQQRRIMSVSVGDDTLTLFCTSENTPEMTKEQFEMLKSIEGWEEACAEPETDEDIKFQREYVRQLIAGVNPTTALKQLHG